jgi:hypothetical protein
VLFDRAAPEELSSEPGQLQVAGRDILCACFECSLPAQTWGCQLLLVCEGTGTGHSITASSRLAMTASTVSDSVSSELLSQ